MSTRALPLVLLISACDGAKISIDSGEGDEAPDTTSPTVSLTSPLDGTTVGATVAFSASAHDDVGVAAVSFLVDNAPVGQATAEPWSLDWNATGIVNGNYEVVAVASDDAGNEARATAQVTIDHESGLDPAAVVIVNPMDNVTICGILTVEVAAHDEVDTVTFALDGATTATDDVDPFTWEWDTTATANGAHTLRATGLAADGRGVQHTLSVNVENSASPCDNAPSVRFTAPEDGAYGQGVVEVTASASDDGGVLKAQFFVDGGLLLEDTSVPYGLEWDTDDFDEGAHTLEVVAFDTASQTTGAEVTFTIDRTAPTVAFTSPAEGDTIRGTEIVTVDATDESQLAWVSLTVDGVAVETLTEGPFSWALDTGAISWGPHTLSVEARDSAGNTATDTIDVFLDNPPDVSFVEPIDGDIVSGVVAFGVTAEDDEGVAGVQVYVDGTSLGTMSSGPYTFVWDTCGLEPGAHEILAEATDLRGNVASTSITVDNDQPLDIQLATVVNDPTTSPTAYVVDDEGGVSVVFDLDGTVLDTVTSSSGAGDPLGECGSSAYTAGTWGSLGVDSGTYVLGATVTNSAGDTASASLSITLEADADGDGYDAMAWDGDDCDDGDASVSPGASESAVGTCDGVDNDCDGGVDEDFDLDGDGAPSVATCSGDLDCDDTDATVYPHAAEICGDGVDQDCSTHPVCGGTGELSLDDQVRITGEAALDGFGSRAWTADVDDDGSPDVLLSAYGDDDGGDGAGSVHVFFGPDFADMSASAADAKVIGEDTQDYVHSMSDGDFDGDGVVDLLVGAYGEETGGNNAGAAYIVSGPITWDFDLGSADAKFYGETAGDNAGYEVCAGDLDGDGLDDAVVGAYVGDAAATDAGAVYVMYGSLSGTTDLGSADARIYGEAASDRAGRSLAVGDLDGDGQYDLVTGAYLEDSGGSSSGAAYVLLGEQTGEVDLADADTKLVGEDATNQAGYAVAVGDLDDDGHTDVLVGARVNGRAAVGAGAVYLISGVPDAGTVDLSTANAIITGEALNDYAGSSVGSVDYDGDGVLDLLVGATEEDTGALDGGAVYVLFGPLAGTSSLSAADALLYGIEESADLGASVVGMDLDLDGFGDVVIGAPFDDAGLILNGAAYVALGGPGE